MLFQAEVQISHTNIHLVLCHIALYCTVLYCTVYTLQLCGVCLCVCVRVCHRIFGFAQFSMHVQFFSPVFPPSPTLCPHLLAMCVFRFCYFRFSKLDDWQLMWIWLWLYIDSGDSATKHTLVKRFTQSGALTLFYFIF